MADDQFLGKGWAFPVTFGNQGRAVTVAEAEEDIRQSLDILFRLPRQGVRTLRSSGATDGHPTRCPSVN